MAEVSHWLEYGEPIGDQMVKATLRTTYATGPNEQRDDEVVHGRLSYEGLELFESDEFAYALHDDGSLLLSALNDDHRQKIGAKFQPLSDIAQLMVAGCSAAQSVDYHMVENVGLTQTAWAQLTNREQQTVSENVGKAKTQLET